MTIQIGTATLTQAEAGLLMGAHTDLGLTTGALGALYFGYSADQEELRQELQTILARGSRDEKVVAAKALRGVTPQRNAMP